MNNCSIEWCEIKHHARGYCKKHWAKWRRGVDPAMPTIKDRRPAIVLGDIAKIPLGLNAKDGYSIIDVKDLGVEKHNWYLGSNGYAMSRIDGKAILLHRLIMGDSKLIYDHINRNRLDNRRSNLRETTYSENNINKTMSNSFKTVYTGVYRVNRPKQWNVKLRYMQWNVDAGCYSDLEEAISARLHLESIYWD